MRGCRDHTWLQHSTPKAVTRRDPASVGRERDRRTSSAVLAPQACSMSADPLAFSADRPMWRVCFAFVVHMLYVLVPARRAWDGQMHSSILMLHELVGPRMQCGQKDRWTTDRPEGPSMPMCMAEDSVSNENFVKIWENDKNKENGQCVTAFSWCITCQSCG